MVNFAVQWASTAAVDSLAKAEWTVDRLIAKGSINWIYGPPGCFKSFAALDIACSIGAGKPWLGRDVTPGAAFLFAGEGGNDLHLRRMAWEKANKTRTAVKIVSTVAALDSDDSSGFKFLKNTIVSAFENAIEAEREERRNKIGRDQTIPFQEKMKLFDDLESEKKPPLPAPAFIVLDTFSTMASDDTKESVTRFFQSLRRLIREYPDVAVLVVDHSTKSGESYMGSLGKLGNSDWFIEAERQGADLVTLKSKKHKFRDLPEQIDLAVRYQSVGVQDSKGRELGSLVCTDGSRQRRIAELVGGDTHAGYILGLLSASDGSMARPALQEGFLSGRFPEASKIETGKRMFRKSIVSLESDDLVLIDDETGIIKMT